MSIGFIGLGNMGSAMARRLLATGLDVGVWNRTASTADALVEVGATRLATVEEAFTREITVSVLADDAAVLSVITPDVLKTNPSALHVNMASVSLEAAREIARLHAEAGVRYLAAPVMGRPSVAEAGQLNILAGGPAETIRACATVLDALGKRTWHVSDHADGATLTKIAMNYNLIHALQSLGESINLVEQGGIDAQMFVKILTDTSFSGSAYTGYGSLIAERSYYPAAFDVGLGLKDLGLTEQAAAELGTVLPTAPAIREMFEEAYADDSRKLADWSIIAEVIRDRNRR